MVPADTHQAVDSHRVVDHILVADTRRVVGRILAVDCHRIADHILAVDCYRDRIAVVVVVGEYTLHIDLADSGLDPDWDSNSCTYSSFLHDKSSIE